MSKQKASKYVGRKPQHGHASRKARRILGKPPVGHDGRPLRLHTRDREERPSVRRRRKKLARQAGAFRREKAWKGLRATADASAGAMGEFARHAVKTEEAMRHLSENIGIKQCQATTKRSDEQCKNSPVEDSVYCGVHQ